MQLTKEQLLAKSPEELAELYLKQQADADLLADQLAEQPASAAENPRVKYKSKLYEVTVPAFKLKLNDDDQEGDGAVFKTYTAADLAKNGELVEKILAIKGQQILKPYEGDKK